MVHGIVVNEGAAPAAAGAEALGQHADEREKILARQIAERPGAADQREEPLLAPFLGGGFGDDLLRHDIEREFGDRETVELAAPDRIEERGAFDKLVARQREETALGRAFDGMAGAADALQERRDRARRADLADEIDIADIDAELQ